MTIKEFTQDPNQVFLLPNNDLTSLRCIDDRYSEKDGLLANYAVPGAGLGLITDVYSGFERVLSVLTEEQIEAIYAAAHDVIGTPTFHTGHGHGTSASPVEGCGYCADTLEGNGHIKCTKTSAFLKSNASKIVQNGYDPVDFKDTKHDASFIIIVDGYDTGVMPTAADGTRAYVVHKTVQIDLLSKITDVAYAKLVEEKKLDGAAVPKAVVLEEVFSASKERFSKVAGGLPAHGGLKASHIPQYAVSYGKEPTLIFDPQGQVVA